MSGKIMVAMSGGVDSSVCAALLHKKYDCTGATMLLVDDEKSRCDIADAAAICRSLGMEHIVLDMRAEFEKIIIGGFVADYENGLTPNPCVACNKYIKFGLLLDECRKRGFSRLATGHYARVEYDTENGLYRLAKAKNAAKDQTYFLSFLTQDVLSGVMFPLGDFESKDEIRTVAESFGLPTAHRRDSQDICFISGDYGDFIEGFTKKEYPHGDFTDESGKILGEHKGLVRYTIGQRKGLGLALPHPMYVKKKDTERNLVILTENENLFSSSLTAVNYNGIIPQKYLPQKDGGYALTVKTRYSQKTAAATVYFEDKEIKVIFDEPQRAICPGQAAVLYDGDYVVGGGIISG